MKELTQNDKEDEEMRGEERIRNNELALNKEVKEKRKQKEMEVKQRIFELIGPFI